MIQDIYIIDNTQNVLNILKQIFKDDVDYQFKSVKTEELNIALKNIPDMIIIDEDTINMDIIELCKSIRENEDNSITPIVVISSEWEKEHRIKILEQSIKTLQTVLYLIISFSFLLGSGHFQVIL